MLVWYDIENNIIGTSSELDAYFFGLVRFSDWDNYVLLGEF
jgi:hypothetical protein